MPKLVISDSGSATPAINVARSERRKSSTTSVTSTTLRMSVNCTSWTEARIVTVRSLTTVSLTPAGIARWTFGISARICRTTSITLAPGWRWISMMTAGVPLIPAAGAVVFQSVDDLRDVANRDRRAVAIGDDDRLVRVRRRNLIVGGDGVGLLRAVQRPLRPRNIRAGDRCCANPPSRCRRPQAARGRPAHAPPASGLRVPRRGLRPKSG